MKLLITGALGNLGQKCLLQALQIGHEVRGFDLDTAANRRAYQQIAAHPATQDRLEMVWGDITDLDTITDALKDIEGIIHNVSLLPPASEDHPELAHRINVLACQELIDAAQSLPQLPIFVFPSSVTVFGVDTTYPPTLKSPDDPVQASDHYTHHKLAVEQYLHNSQLPWVILRVGVSVDARTLKTDRNTFRKLLGVSPNNPLEYVHPNDVAWAMCRAVSEPRAWRKTLLIGGGPGCQVSHHDFMSTAFKALGLELPRHAFGSNTYYTHWMDTTESQQLLEFQNHDFVDYQQEMADKLRPYRFLLAPFRKLINPLLGPMLRKI